MALLEKSINNKPTVFLCLILCLFLIQGLSSCKSHKHKNDGVASEEILSVKPKKDKYSKLRNKIVEESKKWIGTPYKYAHQEKGKGTDCSGMVMVVYEEIVGIKLPRNSAMQADYCHKLKEKEILPGDLVFFATGRDKKKVSHVGIMIDNENFVHASASKGVIISNMTTPYYQRTFIHFGRVPEMGKK